MKWVSELLILGFCMLTLKAIAQPPTITAQPSNQAVPLGGVAIFAVSVKPLGVNFQWQFNGTNLTDSANIFGSTTANLTVSNVTPANVGTYVVLVSNLSGTTTSSGAFLIIQGPAPAVGSQGSTGLGF